MNILFWNASIGKICKHTEGHKDRIKALLLDALYELETVLQRFGGKYFKKAFVTVKELHPVYLERAAEMGIKVR